MSALPSTRKPGFTGWVMHNLPLKLLSLALSIALFSIVHSDQDAQRTVFLDVVALTPPVGSDKMLLTELPHEVKVTLRGSRARINALHRDDFRPITMDVTDTSRRFFYFDPSSVDVDGNIQVASIEPATVVLDWADAAERRVPVKPRLEGTPAIGFELQEPVKLAPAVVTIRGPADTVSLVSAVYTDVISLEGLASGSHVRRVPLEPLPDHTAYVEDASVRAEVVIQAKLVERTLRRLEIMWIGEGEVILRPGSTSVTVRGPAKRVDQLDAEHLVPYVQLDSDAGVGGFTAEVKLRGAEGLEVVKISPASVIVHRRK